MRSYDLPAKRTSLNPAWKEHSTRNMRGETVRWGGTKWIVITHVRGGVWKLGRLSGAWENGDYITLQLDRDGRPVK
jgi:hypothetical protein